MSTRKLRVAVFTLSLAIAAFLGWQCTFLSGGAAIALGAGLPLLFFWSEMHQKRLARKMWDGK